MKSPLLCHRTPETRPPRIYFNQKGAAALLLVSLIMMSIILAISLSNWISVQRRGGMRMRVAIKETMIAQSALQETKLRLISDPILRGCPPLGPFNPFTYVIDRSTITITINCLPYP